MCLLKRHSVRESNDRRGALASRAEKARVWGRAGKRIVPHCTGTERAGEVRGLGCGRWHRIISLLNLSIHLPYCMSDNDDDEIVSLWNVMHALSCVRMCVYDCVYDCVYVCVCVTVVLRHTFRNCNRNTACLAPLRGGEAVFQKAGQRGCGAGLQCWWGRRIKIMNNIFIPRAWIN